MGANSKIEWTHHTFNPWRGCTKVSDGCKNCYAEKLSARNPALLGVWGDKGTRVVASESMWREPLKWDKAAKAAGERHRVFCASLADVFEDRPELEAPRARLYRLIEATPNLDWLLLTKRPENAQRLMQQAVVDAWNVGEGFSHPVWPLNVWIGTSVENQAAADERIPMLLTIPAAVRFLSCEPLLGPVDLRDHWLIGEWCENEGGERVRGQHVDWVICGGESGPNARPMHPDWARELRDHCKSVGVPFHFKQWGDWVHAAEFDDVFQGTHTPLPNAGDNQLRVVNYAGGHGFHGDGAIYMRRVGKKAAGRLLDGREWNELPQLK